MVFGVSSHTHEQVLKHNLDGAMQRFKKSKECTEHSVEQLLQLVEAELTIVDYLCCGQTGMTIEDAVAERDCLLATSVPSVVYLYSMIMDFATYTPLLTSSAGYLNQHERDAYFRRMRRLLEQYGHEWEVAHYDALRSYRV